MKKLVLFFALVTGIIVTKAEEDYGKYLYNKMSGYGRWSVSFEAGLSRFDGDFNTTKEFLNINPQALKGFFTSPNFGGNIEYSLHPNFGVGFNVSAGYQNQNNLTGTETIEFYNAYTYPYVTFDLLSIFRGEKSQRISIWGNLGIGAGFNFAPTGIDDTNKDGVVIKWPFVDNKNYGIVYSLDYMVIPATLTFEYSISKNISVGAFARFMVTNTDYLEGIYRQDFVDFWQTLSLVYRYKFATKEKHHFRDELFDYKDPTTIIINQLQADVAALNDRIDDIDDKLDTLDNRLDKIEGIMAVNGPDADNDGVPDVRDLEPYTPRTNAADFWGRSMTPKSGNKNPVVSSSLPYAAQQTNVAAETEPLAVYFDFDKTDLDKIAHISILRVANRLKKDPSMLVEVRGYCDDPGTGTYNQRLSQRRAEKVKYELINTHGISSNRIVANGKGKIPYPPGRNWTNRRCDFFFSK